MSEEYDVEDEGQVIGLEGRLFSIAPVDFNPTNYLNRELSWLSFNARVLALANDVQVPLLERVKYLAIYASNLDEFFQVRVAGLRDLVAAEVRFRSPDGRTPEEQLEAIRHAVQQLEVHRQNIFTKLLVQLREQDVSIFRYAELSSSAAKVADTYFDEQVFPILTPLAVDPGHPFPYISDLSLNLGVRVRRPGDERTRFARIKIPDTLKRLVRLDEPGSYIRIEDLIVEHLDQLFPGLAIEENLAFRVTRNADLNYRDEEADDLLELVEMELRRRRFGNAVRLEIGSSGSDSIRSLLRRELDIEDSDIYVETAFLAMTDLWSLMKLDRPDLRDEDFSPVVPARVSQRNGEEVDLFEELRNRDLLIHHPYESFAASTQELIRRAATDPDVVAIKMTLYRTSSDSPIIRSLVHAVESGKQVAVLIELRARFDERANIEWAKTLEQAGVHVTYGITGLKIHAKITMIVRREAGRMVRYCHFGTGNYNQGTARLYGDFGLLTSSAKLGDEVAVLFNTLTGYGGEVSYDDLLVAPAGVRTGLSELIRGEMELPDGRIIMKMNSLVDPDMIDLLYEASQAGVEIDLIVRGICGLRPGVPGLSENIRVRSIIGRYLEHARIYHFANGSGDGQPVTYMGSADLMKRNLDHRVEALVALSDPSVAKRVLTTLEMELEPNLQSWDLGADGSWTRDAKDGLLDLHGAFEVAAIERRRAGHPAKIRG
ncbi:MAG: polyphosphate kinase [Verrucomicrobiales bacterium]|jgi:polyphosphate kinase